MEAPPPPRQLKRKRSEDANEVGGNELDVESQRYGMDPGDDESNVHVEARGLRKLADVATDSDSSDDEDSDSSDQYGDEMAEKAFFLDDASITARELLDGQYHFVLCTWQFLTSRWAAWLANQKFHNLLTKHGRAWINQNIIASDIPPWNVRYVNALFSQVYREENLPMRHLILDEAQFAKNVNTETYDAVRNLHYNRILLLSGTFLANRWHDLFGLVSLIPSHPFDNLHQFMKTFAHKEVSGYYSTPSVLKGNRLVKLLMAFTVSRPVSVLNLPPIYRDYHDFTLGDDEEAEVVYYVGKYLKLMSKVKKQQVFKRSKFSLHAEKKALMQAVLAQLSCANSCLHVPRILPVRRHLLKQTVKLRERFAAARGAAVGTVGKDQLLALVLSNGMNSEQALSIEVNEELGNVPLDWQQGETGELQADVPKYDIAEVNQAPDEATQVNNETGQPSTDDDSDEDSLCDYDYFKTGEKREVWLARLGAMEDAQLFSSKVKCIFSLMSKLRSDYPDERIIVFSRFLKFLDQLSEAIRRRDEFADVKPLQINGNLSSEQRSFSQTTFNDPTNKRPIFVTAGSAGAGLNLSGASRIIQSEPWWNHNDELLAQSRAWRMGQQEVVQVYVIRGTNSLIDYIVEQRQVGKTATNTKILTALRRKDNEITHIPRQYVGGIGEH